MQAGHAFEFAHVVGNHNEPGSMYIRKVYTEPLSGENRACTREMRPHKALDAGLGVGK